MPKDNVYTITPPKNLVCLDWGELWRYRELLYTFAWRDVKVRYKQTVLGVGWAIFQPLFTMIIFTVFFGNLAKIPSEGVPYPIFVYTGLLLWNYFSTSLSSASSCLVDNENIIKKVYFPRLLLPLSTAVTPLVDFGFSLIIFFGLSLIFGYVPCVIGILLLPVLLFCSFLTALGVGLFLGSINAKYRDVRYILPFFIQLLMYVTPVIYPSSIIPESYRWVSFLNPMAGVITMARGGFLYGIIDFNLLAMTFGISVLFFMFGLAYFRKTERFLADTL
ncbi:MAG: ABC transporter permease [Candidatus Shapirobacteria bacterium]|jgi:lipopolysaccharide transport system permease protein